MQRLSGVLEVRPYPKEVSLANLLDLSAPEVGDDGPSVIHGARTSVDLRKLSNALDRVNIPDLRRRRQLYNRIYHEASISDEGGKGIAFGSMLLLCSHYVRLALHFESAERLDQLTCPSPLSSASSTTTMLSSESARASFSCHRCLTALLALVCTQTGGSSSPTSQDRLCL